MFKTNPWLFNFVCACVSARAVMETSGATLDNEVIQ